MTRLLCIVLVMVFGMVPQTLFAGVFVEQPNPFVVTTWRDITTSELYYGALEGFPHTFEFVVDQPILFDAQLMVKVGAEPVSLILVQAVERGVSEVIRQSVTTDTMSETVKDRWLGLSFSAYESLSLELTPGLYRLEVSAPANDVQYRLAIGPEAVSGLLTPSLPEVFKIHNHFGSWLFAVRSPFVYWPLVALVLGYVGLRWYHTRYA